MLGPNQQRHVRIVARQVVNRRVSLLLQPKRSRRFSDYPAGDRYTHPALSRRNCDGMVSPRNSDLLAFARFSLHCAPPGISHSFEPPSTGILAPVIQRALWEAKTRLHLPRPAACRFALVLASQEWPRGLLQSS